MHPTPILKRPSSAARHARHCVLISCAALALLLPSVLRAQAAGPLAPATPSDQPVASSSPAPQSSANRIGGKPNLAGTWKLNKEKSDDPREKMREAAQQSGNETDASQGSPQGGAPGGPGGFGYPGGPNGGYGGRGGPYGAKNGGPYGGPNGGPGDDANASPNNNQGGGPGPNGRGLRDDEFAQLTIEQTATSAKISGPSGRLLAAYAATPQDAPPADSNSNGGGNGRRRNRMAPAVAEWQGDQLVATNQTGGGAMTRTYELSSDGRQLVVTTKMENRRTNTPVTYRQVYDPVTVSNDGKNQ